MFIMFISSVYMAYTDIHIPTTKPNPRRVAVQWGMNYEYAEYEYMENILHNDKWIKITIISIGIHNNKHIVKQD